MEPLSTVSGILAAVKQDPSLAQNQNIINKYLKAGGTLTNNAIPTQFSTSNFNTGTIGSSALNNTPEIQIPDKPKDTTNYGSIIAGGNAAIDGAIKGLNTTTGSTNDTVALLQSYLNSQTPPPSTSDIYTAAYNDSGIETQKQIALQKQSAVKAAQAELQSVQAEIQAVVDRRDANNLQLEQDAQGRGIRSDILSRQQAEVNRQAAIEALPLQAKALAAQAKVASVQGESEYAQSTLKMAQDKLDTAFRLKVEDAKAQYDYKKELQSSIYDFLKEDQKTQLAKIQKEDDRAFQIQLDNKNRAETVSSLATSNGQYDLAAKIAALDWKSPTFQQDLAALQGQIVVKQKTETGAGPLSILDVQRYNELYPGANVTAGDTEIQANAKVAAINSPEGKLRSLITAAQANGNSYDTVISEINKDNTITDKTTALKIAKEVYGITDLTATPATPVFGKGNFSTVPMSDRIAELNTIFKGQENLIKGQLVKDGYPENQVIAQTGNIIDRALNAGSNLINSISSYLFGK